MYVSCGIEVELTRKVNTQRLYIIVTAFNLPVGCCDRFSLYSTFQRGIEIYWLFISVINQLDVQNFCFTMSLFHASTSFEHICSSSGGQNCITQPLVSSHLLMMSICARNLWRHEINSL